jgi:hypothetical protein
LAEFRVACIGSWNSVVIRTFDIGNVEKFFAAQALGRNAHNPVANLISLPIQWNSTLSNQWAPGRPSATS